MKRLKVCFNEKGMPDLQDADTGEHISGVMSLDIHIPQSGLPEAVIVMRPVLIDLTIEAEQLTTIQQVAP